MVNIYVDKKSLFLNQLSSILEEFHNLKSNAKHSDFSDKTVELSSLIVKVKATVQRIIGENSEYYKEINRQLDKKFYDGYKLAPIMGIISALKDDVENDYLKSMYEIVHAEIFTDYLEMSEYLIAEGYKDAAAVIAGSTLESHLRELCKKYNIEIELVNSSGKVSNKKAESMNTELNKSDAYNKTFQKQITAWLDLRNNAAHGKYREYEIDEVKIMILGIRNFLMYYPA